jgi:hypothetical protein
MLKLYDLTFYELLCYLCCHKLVHFCISPLFVCLFAWHLITRSFDAPHCVQQSRCVFVCVCATNTIPNPFILIKCYNEDHLTGQTGIVSTVEDTCVSVCLSVLTCKCVCVLWLDQGRLRERERVTDKQSERQIENIKPR